MNREFVLSLIIFIPTIGAFILPFVDRISTRLRNGLAFILVFSSFLLSAFILPHVLSNEGIHIEKNLPLGFNLVFTADALAILMAIISSFISALIVLYSFDYISHYENQNEYYLMVVLFLGSMMGLIFSGNLIFMYIFWEMVAITSWRLIGFFREKQHVLCEGVSFSTHKLPTRVIADYLFKSIACSTIIIGIQPKSFEFCRGFSEEVKKSIKRVSYILKENLK